MSIIFHLITTLERGGAENQLVVLIQEQLKVGMDVHVAYLKGKPELKDSLVSSGATVHDNLQGHNPIFQALLLRKLVKNNNVIMHAHLPRAELVALITPAFFNFFVTRHNCEPFFPAGPRWFSNMLSQLVVLRARRVISISKAVKEFIISRGEIRNVDKAQVVYYGFNPTFPFRRDSVDSSQKQPNLRLGTISRLVQQKNIKEMIDVFARYKQLFPESTLSILGEGHLETDLKTYAAILNLKDSVHFLGRRSNVYEFLSEIDIFLLTSKYEGFGMVLLEAADAGVPIVASRNSSIVEVLGNDFPGLCSPEDSADFTRKILALSNSDYRRKIVEMQTQRLRMFTAAQMNNQILEIYNEGG